MDISQTLGTAANIMLLGMICVFVFLGLLVVALKVLEKVAGGESTPVPAPTVGVVPTDTQVDANVAAAITAAVHKFRQTKLND